MAKLNIGGVIEDVITSEEFTLEKARDVLKDEVVAIVGYGVQGRGQALNLRDNGINVIVGEEYNTKKAEEEGWVPGKTLFPLLEAALSVMINFSVGIQGPMKLTLFSVFMNSMTFTKITT